MTLVPVLERLEALDTPSLGSAGVAAGLAEVQRLRGFLDAVTVRLSIRADELAALGHSADGSECVRSGCRTTTGEAARIQRSGATILDNPALGTALEHGTITLGHIDTWGHAVRDLRDDQLARLAPRQPELLARGEHQTPEEFGRSVREAVRQIRRAEGETRSAQQIADRRSRFGTRLEDGMGWLTAQFDPETAARVFSAIRAERDALLASDTTLTEEQAAADALAGLILGASRSRRPGLTEVVVFIDLESLRLGEHVGTASFLSSSAEIPVSTVRRLCCEAHIVPMVLGGDGMPLDVGRERRLANRAQRRALRRMYRTCAHPDCTIAFDDCHIHHLDPWETLGRTDLANLVPLCSKHHHLVHEGGWHLTLDSRRTLTLRRPDGTLHQRVPWTPPIGETPTPHPDRPPHHTRNRPPDEPERAQQADVSSFVAASA